MCFHELQVLPNITTPYARRHTQAVLNSARLQYTLLISWWDHAVPAPHLHVASHQQHHAHQQPPQQQHSAAPLAWLRAWRICCLQQACRHAAQAGCIPAAAPVEGAKRRGAGCSNASSKAGPAPSQCHCAAAGERHAMVVVAPHFKAAAPLCSSTATVHISPNGMSQHERCRADESQLLHQQLTRTAPAGQQQAQHESARACA
jgi:hypothetical protein